ncbi:MAG: hypothetical protein QGI31_11170 [Dehalococcoidia bacterium]|nr:hypothetical protein [Dehalococcoidia bacterium]
MFYQVSWDFSSEVVSITRIEYVYQTHMRFIFHHNSTVQVIEPPKRVLIEEEICTRLDGCPIVNGVCVDCLTVKN